LRTAFKIILLLSVLLMPLEGSKIEFDANILPKVIEYSSLSTPELGCDIGIVYDPAHEYSAVALKETLIARDRTDHPVRVTMIPISRYGSDQTETLDALYFFTFEPKMLTAFDTHRVITFGAKKRFLSGGLMFYLEMLPKIKIYLNPQTMEDSSIGFESSFLKLVEPYRE
jgi:hypothetical protein